MALACCAQFERTTQPVVTDDDAICRANGVAVGSKEYTNCRKERDLAASRAGSGTDRAHRNLSEDMLNGR
jgi:DICT domain-containing protein